MKIARQIVWLTVALGSIPVGAAAAPPTVAAGYTIEAYVTGLDTPTGLAFSPGGAFGYYGQLFVAEYSDGVGTIYRVPHKGRKVVFNVKSPGPIKGIAFAAAKSRFAPYIYALYHGTPMLRYDAKGKEQVFGKISQHCLVVASGPGGKWGRGLYHLDSHGLEGGDKVFRWTPDGNSTLVAGGLRQDLLGMAFSPGGAFGDSLYLFFARRGRQRSGIHRIDPDGKEQHFVVSPQFRWLNAGAFDTTGNFHGNLFVSDHSARRIFEIDPKGGVKVFLQGMAGPQKTWDWAGGDIVFGPDGAMYVADAHAGTVWRIAPKGLTGWRNAVTDMVMLAKTGPVRGTITDESYSVQTVYGLVKLPAARVVGMTIAKDQIARFRLVDGQVVCGKIPRGKLTVKLPDGARREIAIGLISWFSYMLSESRPSRIKPPLPAAVLRAGDRLAFDAKGSAFKVRTPYGVVALARKDLLEIAGGKDDKANHTVRFTNGSILRGTVEPTEISPALAVGRKLTLGREIAVLRFSVEKSPVTWLTRLDLAGGDVLWGQITDEKLKFRTSDGLVEVRPAEVKELSRGGAGEGSANLAMWAGNTLVGRLEAGTIAFRISPGPKLSVAAKQIVGIVRATPFPPDRVAESVERLVERLGDDSYKVREQAMKLLKTLGPPLRPFLVKHRNHSDLEIRERIKIILDDPRKRGGR